MGEAMKANTNNKKSKRGAAITARRFVINETYGGKRSLSDVLAELLCAEYCRRETRGKYDKRH
jgi:hypothetical protein